MPLLEKNMKHKIIWIFSVALNSITTITMSCGSGIEQHRHRGGKIQKKKFHWLKIILERRWKSIRDPQLYCRRGSVQLWQFLLALLEDGLNGTIIIWTGKGLEFKLVEPEEVNYLT